jgi:VanZ family protein
MEHRVLRAVFVGLVVMAAVALLAAVGATDEIHQIFIPGRKAGLDDFAASVLGAGLGPGFSVHAALA